MFEGFNGHGSLIGKCFFFCESGIVDMSHEAVSHSKGPGFTELTSAMSES